MEWFHTGPTSEWIYYSSRDKATRQLWKVPAAGGAAVRVADNGAFAMIESSDSKYLYYMKTDARGKLYRSAVDGSGEKELLTGVGYSGLALASDRIYDLHDASNGKPELRQSLLATGEDSDVASIDKPLTVGLSVSPDGKSVIFSELQIRSSLMVAEIVH